MARDETALVDLLLMSPRHALLACNRPPYGQHSASSPQVAPYLHLLLKHGPVEFSITDNPDIGNHRRLPFLAVFGVNGRSCFAYSPLPLAGDDCTAIFATWPELPMVLAGELVAANRRIHDSLLAKMEVPS